MDNVTQLEFLRTKYVELSRQYLAALREGNSVAYIKDLSYVLECLSAEIEMLERGEVVEEIRNKN
jgi:hypothetical protein